MLGHLAGALCVRAPARAAYARGRAAPARRRSGPGAREHVLAMRGVLHLQRGRAGALLVRGAAGGGADRCRAGVLVPRVPGAGSGAGCARGRGRLLRGGRGNGVHRRLPSAPRILLRQRLSALPVSEGAGLIDGKVRRPRFHGADGRRLGKAGGTDLVEQRRRVGGRDRNQQAAGGLRIAEQVALPCRETRRQRDLRRRSCPNCAPPRRSGSRLAPAPRPRAGSAPPPGEARAEAGAAAHLQRMAEQAEAGHVGDRVDALRVRQRRRRSALRRVVESSRVA